MSRALLAGLLTLAPGLGACGRTAAPEPPSAVGAPSASAPVASAAPSPPVTVAPLSDRLARPAARRVVAIGDLHGDLEHARRAFRLAGATDASGAWAGGDLVVVQTGDEIDRGDDDRAILDWVDELILGAKKSGGQVIAMLGNHELMNVALDFRYVTPGGFAAFSLFAGGALPASAEVPESARGRAAAFAPGGPYARRLAARPLAAKVGSTVFVHGGVLPKHVAFGLDRLNDEVDAWLRGERSSPPALVTAEDGPVWTREYSGDAGGSGPGAAACATLARTLTELGASRMVVGHTVQRGGVTSACDGKVWRIDVGLSHAFGGPIEALAIEGDQVTLLREGDIPGGPPRAAGKDF